MSALSLNQRMCRRNASYRRVGANEGWPTHFAEPRNRRLYPSHSAPSIWASMWPRDLWSIPPKFAFSAALPTGMTRHGGIRWVHSHPHAMCRCDAANLAIMVLPVRWTPTMTNFPRLCANAATLLVNMLNQSLCMTVFSHLSTESVNCVR